MKCRNCGVDNPDGAVSCMKCGANLPTVHWQRDVATETDATVQLNAQVSVAINTRRIALVLILAVILSIGSTLIGLAISIIDVPSARTLLGAWLVIAVLVMIVGLYIIIFKKRFTKS
jgi:hypothetical protein